MLNAFSKNIIPDNDDLRVKELTSYAILDGYPDKFFNEMASIIGKTFDAPIALVSLVGKDHVVFKGNFGMEDTNMVDRGVSLCSLAVLGANPTIFKNALEEPCLLSNPLVVGEFGLRFYAGAPLITRAGFNIGTVCIVDKKVRNFSKTDTKLLQKFASNIIVELEHRKVLKEQSND
jgi:GAF domain-containing protein